MSDYAVMDEVRKEDENSRKSAVEDLVHSFIVQAPAGSGKTEILVNRYLHLLSKVEKPENILAITFTNKAAGEMRNRVLEALLAAAAGKQPDDEREGQRLKYAKAAMDRDHLQKWQITRNPDRLKIQTMDSFYHGLVSAMPLLSGMGGQVSVEQDSKRLYREAILDATSGVGAKTETMDASKQLLLYLGNQMEAMLEMLASLMEKRDQWRQVLERDQGAQVQEGFSKVIRSTLGQANEALPEFVKKEIPDLVKYAFEHLNEDSQEKLRPLVEILSAEKFPSLQRDDVAAWKSLVNFICKKDGQVRQRINKTDGFPTSADGGDAVMKNRMMEMLGQCRFEKLVKAFGRIPVLPETAVSREHQEILTAIAIVLQESWLSLEKICRSRGIVDFQAIAEAARRALGNPGDPTDLGQILEYKIRHILVDEFQDTSWAQYEILRLLIDGWSAEDGHSLFLVGDPMQSIYQFREAQVGLFLRVMDTGQLGDASVPITSLRLHRNFRSSKDLVSWTNAVFSESMPENDPDTEAVQHTPALAERQESNLPVLQTLFGYAGVQDSYPDKQTAFNAEAVYIVDQIRSLAQDPEIASIAVLVRSRPHGSLIISQLRSSGIAFNAVEMESMASRQEILDLQALTRALIYPADRIAWLSMLRAPWCGLRTDQIYQVVHGNENPAGHETLDSTTNSSRKVEPLIPEILDSLALRTDLDEETRTRASRLWEVMKPRMGRSDRESLRLLVQGAWTCLGGPYMLSEEERTHVDSWLECLEELPVSTARMDPAEFKELITKGMTSSIDPEAKVSIMTIHRAKGLEFDAVILPAVNRTSKGNDSSLLVWDRLLTSKDSRMGFLIAAKAKQGEEDEYYQFIKERRKERAKHEVARLLYVATTRAAKRLIITATANMEKGSPVINKGTFAQLLPGWDGVAAIDQPQVTAEFNRTWKRIASGATFPILPTMNRRLRPVPVEQVEEKSLASIPKAHLETTRIAGIVVHRFLDIIVKEGKGPWDPKRIEEMRPVFQSVCELEGLAFDSRDAAVSMVESCLSRVLTSERGQWILSSHVQDASELPLTEMEAGEAKNSIIDRTFIDEKGNRWIIDYKTADPGATNKEEFIRDHKEKYAEQIQKYVNLFRQLEPDRPVRAALYLPMMDEFVEYSDFCE